MKIIKWLNFYFILLLLSSCTNDLSLADGETWFNTNKEAALILKERLLKNPAIRRVEPKLRLRFVSKYQNFTQNDKDEYEKIVETISALGIEKVSVSRNGSTLGGDLISISYILYTQGIAVSGGKALSVEYIFDDSILNILKERGNTIKPLDESGWYVVQYEGD